MRTLIIIVAGLVLWAACLGIAKLMAGSTAPSMTAVTMAFVIVWLLVAAVNMWLGVSRAGYSVREELPIFLLIFGLPAAAAVLMNWKLL
jgi:hypothetical protein